MFEYHHIYTFFASSGIAGQIFECRILRRYDATNIPDWIRTTTDAEGNPVPIVEPVELESPKGEQTIDWARGNDVYAPMLGSKFDFTLLNVSGSDFIDFADGDFKEFRVDVINLIPDGSIIYDKWGNGTTLNHYSAVQHPKIAETTRAGYKAQLYWRGFVHPVNSKEPIIAPPFNVKYTAVDGLAELGERTMPFHTHNIYRTDTRQLRLIEVIQYALQQTKTDLDLAVNSGIIYIDVETFGSQIITGKNDALIWSYVSVDAFTNKKLIDVVKGILSAFNCRLIQSNGYWYIINPSLINSYNDPLAPATGITWKIYEYDSVGSRTRSIGYYEKEGADRDTDKQLRRSVNGQRSDLIPMESTLAQTLQQPVKSFECTPDSLHSANMMRNEAFDYFNQTTQDGETFDQPNFWTHYDDKVPPGRKLADLGFGDVVVDPLKLASTKEYAYLQSRALESNRLIAEINSIADIWAIGTTYKEVLGFRDATISIRGFAWFTDEDIERVQEQQYYKDNQIFGDIAIPFSVLMETIEGLRIYDFEQNVFLNNDGVTDSNVNFDNAYNIIASIEEKIQGNPNQSQYISRLNIGGGLLERNTFEFQSTSVNINVSGSEFSTEGKTFDFLRLTEEQKKPQPYVLQVVLWYPQGNGTVIRFKNDPANGYPNDNNIVGKTVTLIDSVQVTTKIPDDVLNPTFTRIQTPFRRKETYSPYVVHETDLGVAQRINQRLNDDVAAMFRENTFRRKPGNETRKIDYRDTNDSLEQITTQLKLNDFRRRAQVFEGDVASNHNGYPLFPVQTIDIDFNNWKSGRTPREQNSPEATIFWGGRYNLSTGIFSISTFTPNQFTDISPENRSDISTNDFDSDGQLLPGYYTSRPTAFQDLPERVISGGEAPEPEVPTASIFRITPNQLQRVRVSNNIGNATIPFNVRADGRYTLRGEIFVGNMHIPIELDERGRLTKTITNFISINNQHIAQLHLDIDIPVEGNEETTKIRVDIVRYQIIPTRLSVTDRNISDDIIAVLSNESPESGRPINIIDFSRDSITGEKVQIRYDRMMIFLRPYPTDADGTVAPEPLPIQEGDPIIIDYNNNTLVIIQAPTQSLEPREVTTNQLSVTFTPAESTGGRLTFNIDLNGQFLDNEDVTVNVTSDDFSYFDFDYRISRTQRSTEPISGISVIKSGNNMINVSVNGFLLPRGLGRVQAFVQLFLAGELQAWSLGITINIANHREADDTTL